jgi:pimeloyl-ACP methyl ester carboxylesterase
MQPLIPPSLQGTFAVASYTEGLGNGIFYMNPRISYPVAKAGESQAAVTASPIVVLVYGFGGTQEDSFGAWVQILVSHGYTCIEFDPAIGPYGGGGMINDAIVPPFRAFGAQECLSLLEGENSRQGSPVLGTLDLDKTAVVGHSWGGCASLLAASAFKTVVALCPCNALPFNVDKFGVAVEAIRFPMIFGTYAGDDVPTLILAGEKDPIAIPSEAKMQYDTLPKTTTRALGIYTEGDHVFVLLREVQTSALQQQVATMTLQWLEKYLVGSGKPKPPFKQPSLYMTSWLYVSSPLTKQQQTAIIAVSCVVGGALLVAGLVALILFIRRKRRLQSLQ